MDASAGKPRTARGGAFSSFAHISSILRGGGGGAGGTPPAPASKKRARPAAARAAPAPAEVPSGPILDMSIPEIAELSPAQLRLCTEVLAGRNVFLTGRGGCGKTTALKALCKALDAAGTPYAVTAATGVAAEPLAGTTINAFACIKPNDTLAQALKTARRYGRERIQEPRVLILDEVSMVSEDLLDMVVKVIHDVRRGAPIIYVLGGDFLQLAPVSGAMCLDSPVWASLKLTEIVLGDAWRQSGDDAFLRILDEARFGELSDESVALLRTRVGAPLDTNGVLPTVLTPFNARALAINLARLSELPGMPFVRAATLSVARKDPKPGVGPLGPSAPDPRCAVLTTASVLPTEAWLFEALQGAVAACPPEQSASEFLRAAGRVLKDTILEPVLQLKVGAQVMFTANIRAEKPAVMNGTRGVVTDVSNPERIGVRLASGEVVTATPLASRRAVGDFDILLEQLPLKLAWAITIHKAQGVTLDVGELDIGRGVFAEAQTYVALSRLRSLSGMTLTRFDPDAVKANPKIVAWYKLRMGKTD